MTRRARPRNSGKAKAAPPPRGREEPGGEEPEVPAAHQRDALTEPSHAADRSPGDHGPDGNPVAIPPVIEAAAPTPEPSSDIDDAAPTTEPPPVIDDAAPTTEPPPVIDEAVPTIEPPPVIEASTPKAEVAPPPPPATAAPQPAIRIAGLTKRYGKLTALSNLHLDVERGEVFGFLGPNGSGKSTTIRTLLGYLRPSAGTATLLGLDIASQSLEIRRRCGYLPSGVAFEETVSGERALDDLAALQGRPSVRRAELCERLQLPRETLRRRVRDYSRGMRQKLGIIQALQHDPELLILDEPTEGLDPLMQHAFYAIIRDLRNAGRTVFFSSHVLSEVERVCDRVAIIRNGTRVAVENVHDLLARRRRRVEVRFDGEPPRLDGIVGISKIEQSPGFVSCRLAGPVTPLLHALTTTEVTDLLIEPARLEDVFLEFYGPSETGA